MTTIRDRFLVNVRADMLINIHAGAPLGRVLDHTQTLLQRRHLFYNVSALQTAMPAVRT